MGERHGSAPAAEARGDDLLRREALRRASAASLGSPPALESTLASISAEVMEEALARLNRTPGNKA